MKVWVSAAWFLAGVLVTATVVVAVFVAVAFIADDGEPDPVFQVEDCIALDKMRETMTLDAAGRRSLDEALREVGC